MDQSSYNNAQHASIGCSPFFANYGFNTAFNMEPSCGSKVEAVVDFAKLIKKVQQGVSTNLDAAMQALNDKEETPEAYLVDGELEWEVKEIVDSFGSQRVTVLMLKS
ncbi:hypothetical protein L0F63_000212 [Massospora cicadina]|nr:hypothetical protein L0F63_000212 [Massospora cicadina]